MKYKYKVIRGFSGFYDDNGVKKRIRTITNEVIDLPEVGHDFVKAGLVERYEIPKKRSNDNV